MKIGNSWRQKGNLERFLDLDEQRRQLLVKQKSLKYRNDVSGEIAKLNVKNDAADKIAEMKEVGVKIKALIHKWLISMHN